MVSAHSAPPACMIEYLPPHYNLEAMSCESTRYLSINSLSLYSPVYRSTGTVFFAYYPAIT